MFHSSLSEDGKSCPAVSLSSPMIWAAIFRTAHFA